MVLDGFLTVTPDNGVPNVDGEIINNTCTQNDSTSGRIVSYVFQTSPVSTVNNGTECDATIDID